MSKTKSEPFKATRFWNETVETFLAEMPRKRHMRQLKFYNNCFTARHATDHLLEILRNNPSLKNDVVRQQAVLLLGKFHQANIIEPVQEAWKHEDLQDNNQLLRFVCERDDMLSEENCSDDIVRSNSWSCAPRIHTLDRTHKQFKDGHKSTPVVRRGRPIRPRRHTESSAILSGSCVWGEAFVSFLKSTLQVESLEHIPQIRNLNDRWIKVNIANEGFPGATQESMGQDVPRWVARAMKCLASWKRDLSEEQSQYEEIEKNLFGIVVGYFTKTNSSPEKGGGHRSEMQGEWPATSSEPLLTSTVCRLVANLTALKECSNQSKEMEVLQLCLLLLSPARRRKLQLLLRFMSRVAENPHLSGLHDSLCTRDFLLQTFSKVIYNSSDSQKSGSFDPTRLVSYLMKFHEQVMRIPEEFLIHLKETEKNPFGSFDSRVLSVRPRSPSAEAIKAIISGAKHKLPTQKLSEKLMKRKKHGRSFTESAVFSTPTQRKLTVLDTPLGVLANETVNLCCDLHESSKERSSPRKNSQSDSQNSLRSLLCRLWKN